eukprot:COSAG02_NODE_358_length_23882_cov_25.508683_8_plen_307_part_00
MPVLTLPLYYHSSEESSGGIGGCAKPVSHYTVREICWEQENWPGVISRLQPLSTAFMSEMHGSFVRDDEYWATWMLSPAEALDPAGSPTRGIMRGWEVVAEEEDGGHDGLTVIAYAIFKRAGSFSSGAETTQTGNSYISHSHRHRQQSHRGLTLMDFASQARAGSATSEGWLMYLSKIAAQSYYDDASESGPTTDVVATVTVRSTYSLRWAGRLALIVSCHGWLSIYIFTLHEMVCLLAGDDALTNCSVLCVGHSCAQCPSLLAPVASQPKGGAEPSAQGEWMYCDVNAANAGMPAIVRTIQSNGV